LVLEANSGLMEILQSHKNINNCNFEILNKAYSPTEENLEFLIKDSFLSSTAQYTEGEGETVEVDSVSLEDLSERFSIESFSLVADIEGAEYDMLKEEFDLISEKCGFALIEFHNTEKEKKYKELIEKLKENGFREIAKNNVGKHSVHAFRKI
jgi:FkbM family methyltransferase